MFWALYFYSESLGRGPTIIRTKTYAKPVFKWNWPRFSLYNVTFHGNFQTVA